MKTRLAQWLVAGGFALALSGGVVIGEAIASQPHMQAALGYLQSAKSELQVAEHNKGGHRVAALRYVNDAIAETQAGMAAAE